MWPFDRKADASTEPGERGTSARDRATDNEPHAGFETPADLVESGKRHGELYGAARVEPDLAFGLASGPIQAIDGGSETRKGLATRDHYKARIPVARRVSTKGDRKLAKSTERESLIIRLRVLIEQRLPELRRARQQAKDDLVFEREGFQELPRHRQGYFDSFWHVVLIEVLVVAYDSAVLRPALKQSGLGLEGQALLYMSIVTPLAILAVNYGLGLLAGAFALRAPSDWRPRVALMTLVAGCIGLLVTFLLLAIFRADATAAHSHAIEAIAEGKKEKLALFISPWWFGPLQLVGSLAAISVMGLYVAGKEGRDQKKTIENREHVLVRADNKVEAVEEEIEVIRRQIGQAAVAAHEIDADAASAKAEILLDDRSLAAELKAEDGLREAAKGAFRTAYTYNDKIFGNGKVWRVALATIKRNETRTPPPEDQEIPSQEPPHDTNGQRTILDEFDRYNKMGKRSASTSR
jgi:hypothetical protein